ncbi:MAG: Crp/Fnr family transcriptional regulator [Bacteroidales bacterium]|nr:Crp/Fnr family transcriptional regulator [Bacteroidales bacterium]
MKTIVENDQNFICEIQSPIFQLLKPAEVELIRSSKTRVIFHKGENLTKQGAYSSYILFLINGLVKKHMEDASDKFINISLHKNGELIGLSSIFQNKKYAYTTVALTETETYLIECSSLQAVLKENSMFSYEVIKQYCMENHRIMQVLHQMSFKQMYSRISLALLYLTEWSTFDIFQLLNRREIAAFAGLSVETTIKLLKELEQENILQLKEKDITILKKDKLIEYSRL